MSEPSLNYDKVNDILYIVIREGEEYRFDEVTEGIIIEFDENDQVIGIEISNAAQVMAHAIGPERLALVTA
jgi:uncharacterized protein YuzE